MICSKVFLNSKHSELPVLDKSLVLILIVSSTTKTFLRDRSFAENKTQLALVFGKTRVASIEKLSIPKLEFQIRYQSFRLRTDIKNRQTSDLEQTSKILWYRRMNVFSCEWTAESFYNWWDFEGNFRFLCKLHLQNSKNCYCWWMISCIEPW